MKNHTKADKVTRKFLVYMKYHTKADKVTRKFLVYMKNHTKASKVMWLVPRLCEIPYKSE